MQAETTKLPTGVRWSLGLLGSISVLNFVDRQIVNILAEPIKNDLELHDWQVGLLTGLAFAFFYATLSLPAARLAEHVNRPRLLGGAIAIWSLFTAACGLAHNFVQLALARVGVAVGESAAQPAAYSLIADYVPARRRAFALSIFHLANPIGAMLGMAIGGIVYDQWGWRAAFLFVGLPGLVVALIAIFALPEPRAGKPKNERPPVPPLKTVLKELLRKKSFLLLFPSACIIAAINYGVFAFVASFFLRAHGETLKAWDIALAASTGISLGPTGFLGTLLGLAAGITGTFGALYGGKLTDRFAAQDVRWNLYIPALASVTCVPLYYLMVLTPSTAVAIGVYAIHTMILATMLAPVASAFISLVQPQSRATAASFHLIASGLVGLGLGPVFIGIVSDMINNAGFGPVDGLRYSLMAIKSLALVAGVGLFIGARYYRDEYIG